jgi:hypothetical protein
MHVARPQLLVNQGSQHRTPAQGQRRRDLNPRHLQSQRKQRSSSSGSSWKGVALQLEGLPAWTHKGTRSCRLHATQLGDLLLLLLAWGKSLLA